MNWVFSVTLNLSEAVKRRELYEQNGISKPVIYCFINISTQQTVDQIRQISHVGL